MLKTASYYEWSLQPTGHLVFDNFEEFSFQTHAQNSTQKYNLKQYKNSHDIKQQTKIQSKAI